MPLDVGETINQFADAFLKAPIVGTIARNPIYTTLMITFIVMLIVMFIFRDADTEESLLVMCLRSGFWVFIMMLGILFLHNKVLTMENAIQGKNEEYDGVFKGAYGGENGIPSAILEDSIVPVQINTDFM